MFDFVLEYFRLTKENKKLMENDRKNVEPIIQSALNERENKNTSVKEAPLEPSR
jgi:hypothetical protein